MPNFSNRIIIGKSIILLFILFCFSHCEKCYDCELKANGVVQQTESFCGSVEEANTLEAAGFVCRSN